MGGTEQPLYFPYIFKTINLGKELAQHFSQKMDMLAQRFGSMLAMPIAYLTASRYKQYHRSVAAQMILLGALSFVGPAIADAITNLGGGGLSSPYLANLANSLNYTSGCLMTLFGGPLINKLGIKNACVIAAIAMPLTGTGYYSNAQYGITWYLLTAQLIGGFTSGFLYVAEATAMLSYPQQDERGFYLGIWSAMRNSGSIVGGAINFAKNRDNPKAGAIASSTYLLFVALECSGLFWALNLTPTHLVRRNNGTKISTPTPTTWERELCALRYQLYQKKTWLISIPAFYSFYHGGTLSSYLSLHFSIRSRALSSFISPFLAVPSVIAFGRLILDFKQLSQRKRAKIAALFWIVPQVICLLWIGYEYGKFERGMPILDYNHHFGNWTEAYLPSLLMFITGCFTQLSLYWIIGTLSDTMSTNSQLGGLFRAFETAGMAVSYAMNSSSKEGIKRSFYLNIFLLILAIPCMIKLIQLVPHSSTLHNHSFDEERRFINNRSDFYPSSEEEPEMN